jgi:hypothetical protein
MPPGTFQSITDMPLVCTKLPGTIWAFAMWSLGVEGGAARSNSGPLTGELGRGVAGEGLGVERTRSGYSLAVETGPTGGHGGDPR